jgi:small GTP-binding protein
MCLLNFGASSLTRFHKLDEAKDARVLMVGSDAAGKTSVLHRMKSAGPVKAAPTVGFNVEAVHFRNMNITIEDMGSQSTKIRSLWRHHLDGAKGLVYVLDSIDHASIDAAKVELEDILAKGSMRKAAVLIFANAQDLRGALSAGEVTRKLGLQHRKCLVQQACATNGSGITQGLHWLAAELDSL